MTLIKNTAEWDLLYFVVTFVTSGSDTTELELRSRSSGVPARGLVAMLL